MPESGIPPWPFHLANLLVHCTNAILVMLILRRAAGIWPALAGAAIFAVHPIQVEAVAWATGMKDLLSSALGLGAILTYLRSAEAFRDGDAGKGHRNYSAALLLCFLGTLAKPGIMGLPIIAAALDVAFISGLRKSVLWRFIGLTATVLPSAYWTRNIQHIDGYHDNLHWSFRPLIACHAIGFYICKIFYPTGFAVDYGVRPINVALSHASIPVASISAAILLLPLRLRKHRAICFIAIIIFLAGVFPVLGLVPFGFQFYSTVADRYVYVSMMAISLAAALCVVRLKPRFAMVAVGLLVACLALQSFRYATMWRSTVTVMVQCARVNPNSTVAYNNMAAAVSKVANLSIKTRESSETPVAPAWAIPTAVADEILNLSEAMYYHQLSISTRYPVALRNLIFLAGARGRYGEAAELGELAHRCYWHDQWLPPPSIVGEYEMAWLYTELGNVERAWYWMALHLYRNRSLDEGTRTLLKRLSALGDTGAVE